MGNRLHDGSDRRFFGGLGYIMERWVYDAEAGWWFFSESAPEGIDALELYRETEDPTIEEQAVILWSQMPVLNRYGYKVDINDDRIHPAYLKYQEMMKIPYWAPLSDTERVKFELWYLEKVLIRRERIKKQKKGDNHEQ